MGAESFRADRRDEANSHFSQFCVCTWNMNQFTNQIIICNWNIYFILYILQFFFFFKLLLHIVLWCNCSQNRHCGSALIYTAWRCYLQLECLSKVMEIEKCIVVSTARMFCVYLANIPTVVLWLMTPCSLVGCCRCCWGTKYLHLYSFICIWWLLNMTNCQLQ